MAIQIDPVVINDGDPVSAEVIQRMNANIAKVALGEKVTVINIQNKTGADIKSANTTISSSFNATATPGSPLTDIVKFPVAWKDVPAVTMQIMNPNAAGIKQLHQVYLVNVTSTQFKWILIASGATGAKADACVISWIACGNVDTSTQA